MNEDNISDSAYEAHRDQVVEQAIDDRQEEALDELGWRQYCKQIRKEM